jgi:ketosteroid isomerase-like protein
VRIFIGLAVAVSLAGLATAAAQDANTNTDAIRGADEQWERVFTAKNLDASVAVCAPDGAVLPPNAPAAAGREQIRKLFEGFFATPGFQISWHATAVGVARSGDLGYTTGFYDLRFNDQSGKAVTDTGKYVTVWRQSGGAWQVVRDIFNSDLAPGK